MHNVKQPVTFSGVASDEKNIERHFTHEILLPFHHPYSSGDYLDRVKLLPAAKRAKVSEMGHLEQRGVLRTNCIDCLDR